MGAPGPIETNNRLLACLPPAAFLRLQPHLVSVVMNKGDEVLADNDAMDYAYFPESGVGSIVSVTSDGQEAEAGLFGRDGFAPVALIMGARASPNRVLFQLPGHVWRIERQALIEAVDASPPLRDLLLRYVQTLMVQMQYTALSNAVHPIDERLSRWLLMCDDRSDEIELPLTHEFMALMLAVRRSSVTTSLHVLEGNGFIHSNRGSVIIRDRAGLEAFAGDAYGRPEAVYRDLIGPL